MESFKNLAPGTQFLVVAGLCALVALAVWFFVIKGQKEQIESKQQELDALNGEISKAKSLKKQLEVFEGEIESLERKLETLVKILPSEKDVEVLIRRVEHQARQSNLDIKQFDPRDVVPREYYAEWPIYISMNGDYHNLALFFDRISGFDRIINANNLSIQALRGRGSNPRQTMSASCVTTTFVFMEEAE